jgi:hypothetical protein
MLARARFDRIEDCDTMMFAFTSQAGNPESIAFYEWIDPNTEQGHGAFPFRTGISTMRVLLTGFLFKIMREYTPLPRHQYNSFSMILLGKNRYQKAKVQPD